MPHRDIGKCKDSSSRNIYNDYKPRPVRRTEYFRRHLSPEPDKWLHDRSSSKSPNNNKENNSTNASKEPANKYVQTTLIPVFYVKDEQVSVFIFFYKNQNMILELERNKKGTGTNRFSSSSDLERKT